MVNIYYMFEGYSSLHRPEFGVPNGMKIVVLDPLGKGEFAYASIPMDPRHPLYAKLIELGGRPEHYPVEIYRPLVFTDRQPYLQYKQPNVVKPFTIALEDLSMQDWTGLIGLTPSQTRLHDAIIKEVSAGKD